MFKNAEELLALTEARSCRISDIVLARECALTQKTPEEVYARLRAYLGVMREAAEAARTKALPTRGGLISGDARRLNDYAQGGRTICGSALVTAMARALSGSEVNASMGRICAAPTAGASGILPAVILGVAEQYALPEQSLPDALLTASGVGLLIEARATLSGARGGCQRNAARPRRWRRRQPWR